MIRTLLTLPCVFGLMALTLNAGETPQKNKSNEQLVEANLDEGQTIQIPAGGELLELTVAVPETVRTGQRYIYKARLKNVSQNTTLTNIRLTQVNGAALDIDGAKPMWMDDQPTTDHITWSMGKLMPGKTAELQVLAVATKPGEAEHCFAVDYQETLCTALRITNPNVTIQKSGPELVGVCEPFTYKYTLKNTGTGVAKDFVIREELPAGFMTESGKKMVEFRVPQLAAGKSESFKVSLHAMKAGTYDSRAMVEQKGGNTNESQAIETRVVAPELELTAKGPRAFKAGEGGRFDVTVENTSEVTAYNTYLTLKADSKNVEFSDDAGGDARENGVSYRYKLGDLEPGASETISVELDADEEARFTMSAVAKAYCEREDENDLVIAKADGSLDAQVLKITSLLLSIVDTTDVVPTDSSITYRVKVKNQGEFKDTNVALSVELPEGLSYKSSEGPTKADATGRKVSFAAIDTLEPGQSVEFTITCNTETAGEKIVEAVLSSDETRKNVEGEELSTIYEAGRQVSKN